MSDDSFIELQWLQSIRCRRHRFAPFSLRFRPFIARADSRRMQSFRTLAHPSLETPFKNGENGRNGRSAQSLRIEVLW
ncbi:MAG: hypothetical protein JSS04_28275 [Proteobacteria bacterium]|nr:hypothetical protein [Pseudomonadota bacterium]